MAKHLVIDVANKTAHAGKAIYDEKMAAVCNGTSLFGSPLHQLECWVFEIVEKTAVDFIHDYNGPFSWDGLVNNTEAFIDNLNITVRRTQRPARAAAASECQPAADGAPRAALCVSAGGGEAPGDRRRQQDRARWQGDLR